MGGAAQLQPVAALKNVAVKDEPDIKAVRQKMAALLMKTL